LGIDPRAHPSLSARKRIAGAIRFNALKPIWNGLGAAAVEHGVQHLGDEALLGPGQARDRIEL
jgi:hypothetical protein